VILNVTGPVIAVTALRAVIADANDEYVAAKLGVVFVFPTTEIENCALALENSMPIKTAIKKRTEDNFFITFSF
jgi:hypothetical protein